jgi:hypothetical protein
MPSYVPAGEVTGMFRIRINNTDRIQAGLTLATIRLTENAHFRNDFTVVEHGNRVDGAKFRFFLENSMGMPTLWASAITEFTNAFGVFSIAKFELMMEVIGFDRDFLNHNPEEETTTQALNRIGLSGSGPFASWARMMNHYLNAYYEETGSERVDENGLPIRMGWQWAL